MANGPSKNGKNRRRRKPVRDEHGRWVDGNPGGPGRNYGVKVDFRLAARRVADEEGVDIPKEVGRLALQLLNQAKEGDVAAAKFVVERLCGLLKQEHSIEADTTVRQGPPVPETADLRAQVLALLEDEEKEDDASGA